MQFISVSHKGHQNWCQHGARFSQWAKLPPFISFDLLQKGQNQSQNVSFFRPLDRRKNWLYRGSSGWVRGTLKKSKKSSLFVTSPPEIFLWKRQQQNSIGFNGHTRQTKLCYISLKSSEIWCQNIEEKSSRNAISIFSQKDLNISQKKVLFVHKELRIMMFLKGRFI